MNFYVDLLLRWIHILGAIALVGGTFFWRFTLSPALNQLQADQREALHGHILPRWAKVVGIASLLLLVSGLFNAVRAILRYDFDEYGSYHILVAAKLVLAMAVFFIAARLSGRSDSARKFREKMSFWLNVNVLLAVTLVCIAGFMKLTPHIPKTEIKDTPPALESTTENPQ